MKKWIGVVVGVILLVIVTPFILVSLISPAQFKPLIEEQFADKTALQLDIAGELNWQWWPNLALTAEQISLSNPALSDDERQILSTDKATISIALQPLLSRQLVVNEVTVIEPQLFIVKDAVGQFNFVATQVGDSEPSSLEGKDAREVNEEGYTENDALNAIDRGEWSVSMKGLKVVNGEVKYQDQQSGQSYQLSDFTLTVADFALDTWTPIALSTKLNTEAQSAELALSSQVNVAPDFKHYRLKHIELGGDIALGEQQLNNLVVKLSQYGDPEPSQLSLSGKLSSEGVSADVAFSSLVHLHAITDSLRADDTVLDYAVQFEAAERSPVKGALRADIEWRAPSLLFRALEFTANQTRLLGQLELIAPKGDSSAKLIASLKTDKLDIDAWLPAKSQPIADNDQTTSSTSQTSAAKLSRDEPNLSAMSMVDLDVILHAQQLIIAKLPLQRVETKLRLDQGRLSISRLSGELYDGNFDVKAMLDSRSSPATYSLSPDFKGIDIHPLLVTLGDFDKLEGQGDLTVSLNGRGLSPYALRKQVIGNANLSLVDGSISGVNVAEMIREARAKLKGQGSEYKEEVRKTDFSALTASIDIRDGVAVNRDLILASPLLRVSGEGSTHLLKELINYHLNIAIVESSKGQGGEGIDELRDINIPVDVTGTWQAPEYQLDVAALLKQNVDKELEQRAKKELSRGLDRLLGDSDEKDKVKDAANQLLKGLFN